MPRRVGPPQGWHRRAAVVFIDDAHKVVVVREATSGDIVTPVMPVPNPIGDPDVHTLSVLGVNERLPDLHLSEEESLPVHGQTQGMRQRTPISLEAMLGVGREAEPSVPERGLGEGRRDLPVGTDVRAQEVAVVVHGLCELPVEGIGELSWELILLPLLNEVSCHLMRMAMMVVALREGECRDVAGGVRAEVIVEGILAGEDVVDRCKLRYGPGAPEDGAEACLFCSTGCRH